MTAIGLKVGKYLAENDPRYNGYPEWECYGTVISETNETVTFVNEGGWRSKREHITIERKDARMF